MGQLSRRNLLVSGGMFASLPLMPTAALGGSVPNSIKGGMQFDSPQHNLDAMIRLKGGTDNKTRYFYGEGRAFAVFDDELAVPLFNAKAVAWERNKPNDDGSYTRQTSFVQYHYNLDGSSGLWTNPVTGKEAELPVFKNEFGEVQFTTRGPITAPEMKVRTLHGNNERVHPWVVIGDDVWMVNEDMASYFSQREQREQIENAVRSYHCSLDHLNDLSLASVPSTMCESAASALFSFLEMPKEKKGYMLWRFISKKFEDPAKLPSDIRRQIDANNPELWDTEKSG